MAELDNHEQVFVGVDFGGTKILSAVFDADLNCIGRAKKKTKADRGKEAVIIRIADCINEALQDAGEKIEHVRAIGIGAPGAIDTQRGIVLNAPNLQWANMPLQGALEQELGRPVFLENDCNIALLGIVEKEFPSSPKSIIGIFIGTGVGGAIMFDGRLYSGFTGTAGEVGHMIIKAGGPKCSCGNFGCLESLTGRKAIFRELERRMKAGESTLLGSEPDLEGLRSRALRKAIKNGDKLVSEVVEEAAEYIGVAVGSLINVLGPQIVVLGGGVIESLEEPMMPVIVSSARRVALGKNAQEVAILSSALGDDAGIVGGAVLARSRS